MDASTTRAEADADSEPGRVVEIRTTLANDICLALTGCLLAPLGIWWIISGMWTTTDSELAGWRDGRLVLVFKSVVGAPGLALIFAVFTLWLGCLAAGGIWRLLDRRPALRASPTGLQVHPSMRLGGATWDEVEVVRLTDDSPARVRLLFRKRFWSPWVWFTGRALDLNLIAVGLTHDAGQAAAARLERWRRA